jgi:dCMP deaminase
MSEETNAERQYRQDWDSYFLDIARAASTRATCDRLHVGCVLVTPRSRTIIATGYNGSVRKAPHCDEVGHDMDEGGHCVRTVHAEANALAQAASNGSPTEGATAYVTHLPCWPCAKLLLNAGIKEIVYGAAYRLNQRTLDACATVGCRIRLHPEGSAASSEA